MPPRSGKSVKEKRSTKHVGPLVDRVSKGCDICRYQLNGPTSCVQIVKDLEIEPARDPDCIGK